jgi:hypothetical protein
MSIGCSTFEKGKGDVQPLSVVTPRRVLNAQRCDREKPSSSPRNKEMKCPRLPPRATLSGPRVADWRRVLG